MSDCQPISVDIKVCRFAERTKDNNQSSDIFATTNKLLLKVADKCMKTGGNGISTVTIHPNTLSEKYLQSELISVHGRNDKQNSK